MVRCSALCWVCIVQKALGSYCGRSGVHWELGLQALLGFRLAHSHFRSKLSYVIIVALQRHKILSTTNAVDSHPTDSKIDNT